MLWWHKYNNLFFAVKMHLVRFHSCWWYGFLVNYPEGSGVERPCCQLAAKYSVPVLNINLRHYPPKTSKMHLIRFQRWHWFRFIIKWQKWCNQGIWSTTLFCWLTSKTSVPFLMWILTYYSPNTFRKHQIHSGLIYSVLMKWILNGKISKTISGTLLRCPGVAHFLVPVFNLSPYNYSHS